MSKETLSILTNKEVIAVNQDELGVQGWQYSVKDSVETWFKPLKGGDWAVAFLNRSTSAQQVSFDWKNEQVVDDLSKAILSAANTVYAMKNIWTNKEAGTTKNKLTASLPAHDVLMFKLTKPGNIKKK
jgi:alpha-galactosidase